MSSFFSDVYRRRFLFYWLLPLTFLALFYFYPLARILALSLTRAGAQTPDGISALSSALTSPTTRSVIAFTFGQAIASTLLTLLVGLPGAYILARYDFRGKSLFRALTGVPFVMPTLVVAAGFNALLGPTGWVNTLLIETFHLSAPPIQFLNTLGAILTAHVFYNTTIVLRVVGDFWARLDPRLGNAARVLGASPWETFRRVSLPLLLPAIAAAALLVFIFDFSSFAVILVLGGPQFATLETEIYYQTTALFNLPLAAVLSLIQLLCTLALTILYTRLSAQVSRPLKQRSTGVTMKKIPHLFSTQHPERSSKLPASQNNSSPAQSKDAEPVSFPARFDYAKPLKFGRRTSLNVLPLSQINETQHPERSGKLPASQNHPSPAQSKDAENATLPTPTRFDYAKPLKFGRRISLNVLPLFLTGLTIRLTLAFILLLTTAPLLALAARSFVNLSPTRTRTGELERGPTLAFYAALAEDTPQTSFTAPPGTALSISLGYATATVILSLALGLPAAWALAHDRASRLNRMLDPLLMLPLGTSAVTLGLGFIVALNRPPLDLRTSPLLIPLAHTLVAFPFVVRSLTPALQSIQPRLRQAASVLGAAPGQVIRYVDLPLVGRALLVAATFAFTISLGEFGATALIARPEYPTVPVAIYRLLGRPGALNYGQGLALSTILMLVTAGGMLVIERLRVGEGEEF